MTSRDFCYWLQGFFEITDADRAPHLVSAMSTITPGQQDMIRRHLALVFKHEIDPSIDKGDPKKKAELDNIHAPQPTRPVYPGHQQPLPWELGPVFAQKENNLPESGPTFRC